MVRFLFIAVLLLTPTVRAELMTGERRDAFQRNLKKFEEKARATVFPLKMKDGALILDFEVLKAVTEEDVKAHRMPMAQPGAVGHWNQWAEYLAKLVRREKSLAAQHWTGFGVDTWKSLRFECDLETSYYRYESESAYGSKKKDYVLIAAEGTKGLRVRVLKAGIGADLKQESGKATLTFYLEDGKEKKIEAATAAECFANVAEIAEPYFFGILAEFDVRVERR